MWLPATRHQFRNRNRNRNRNRKNSGTGKIQEQVWCVHPQWTNHLPLPSPSLIGPRPCPRRPTAFRFFADDHQPRLAERYSPPTPPPLSRLPSYGPSIGRHGARVCFPRIHTDPCHLTDGKKEGEEGRKKKKDGLGTSTSSGPLGILPSSPHRRGPHGRRPTPP